MDPAKDERNRGSKSASAVCLVTVFFRQLKVMLPCKEMKFYDNLWGSDDFTNFQGDPIFNSTYEFCGFVLRSGSH